MTEMSVSMMAVRAVLEQVSAMQKQLAADLGDPSLTTLSEISARIREHAKEIQDLLVLLTSTVGPVRDSLVSQNPVAAIPPPSPQTQPAGLLPPLTVPLPPDPAWSSGPNPLMTDSNLRIINP